MSKDHKTRIEEMYTRDCIMAWFDVVLLWVTVLFVLYEVLQFVQDGGIRLALYVACFFLLVFNTASVGAMTRHFKEDKEYIYGLDLKHLDANKKLLNH